SRRCKDIDLGAWADESFRLPDSVDPHDPSGDEPTLLQ
ncbi:MAG: DNA gyrase inhibitor YacG, partial [Burkholderiaceae bacterium]